MTRFPVLYALGHGVRLVLFVVWTAWALAVFRSALAAQGWGARSGFALLLVVSGVLLMRQAVTDLRRSLRRPGSPDVVLKGR